MHPRNIYKDNPPDFKELAIKYPYFRSHSRENSSGAVTIDFKDPKALRGLTCALLENDFDLRIEIPLDRLIPTVPLRLNYILWIEDLVGCLSGYDTQKSVIGVDIGTGSSCIYPLLGAKLNGWTFLATELDESSLQYAKNNVKQNGLTDKITVQQVSSGSYLKKPLEEANLKEATFCMCNPPFFSSEDEATLGSARTDKRPLPISISTGSTVETVTSGGEVEFVKKIIDDSLQLQDKVSWYTTMVGKKTSTKSVLSYLREKKVPSMTTSTFNQGKTMRWGVAWTFLPHISVHSVSPPPAKRRRHHNKPLSFTIPGDCPVLKHEERNTKFEQVVKLIKDLLVDLKIVVEEHQSDGGVCSYRCSACEITWSHQRKKRRELQRLEGLRNCSSTASGKRESQEDKHCETKTEDYKNLGLESIQMNKSLVENTINSDMSDVKNFECVKVQDIADRNHSESLNSTDNNNTNQMAISENIKNSNGQELNTSESQGNSSQTPLQSTDISSDDVRGNDLCTFWVRLKEKVECKDQILVEVECIQANNKNNVYQLYQYLLNKILKAK